MAKLKTTLQIKDIEATNYVAIYLVGGVSTMWDFPQSADLQNLIASFYEKGLIVSGVCHGPAALVNVKLNDGSYLIANKKISSFTDEEETERHRENVVRFLLESKLRE